MSIDLSTNSSISPPIEAQHIYQNNSAQSRAYLVDLIPSSLNYDDEYENEEIEKPQQQFNNQNPYIQKRHLKVKFDQNDRHPFDQNDRHIFDQIERQGQNVRNKNHNYDPWRDIYVSGNFDRKVEQKKADRKSSLDHTEYAEEDENAEYEYIDDEDLVFL